MSGDGPIDLDSHCSIHLKWRDLLEAGETFKRLKANPRPEMPLAPLPAVPQSWANLASLARQLDFLIGHFGSIDITYGFAPPALTCHIKGRIEPRLDQHAACELGSGGKLVCARGGAAVDFLVPFCSMDQVARWAAEHLFVDRLYYYGPSRPLHMSWHPEPARSYIHMKPGPSGRLIPQKLDLR